MSDRKIPAKLKFRVCLFSENDELSSRVQNLLNSDGYKSILVSTEDLLIDVIQTQPEEIDCLLVCSQQNNRSLWLQIHKTDTLLPLVIIYQNESKVEKEILYHSAEIKFNLTQSKQLTSKVDLAIANFLNLIPCILQNTTETIFNSLVIQQRRLRKKIEERLGYLSVYNRRNPQNFYQNMTEKEQKKLKKQLAKEYRNIILIYFENEPDTNKIIDSFVNLAFFSDISISKILEIHMELMDEFSKQIKLEGRSEDILIDYRLALIDIMSHLCEMYRRSINKKDIPLEVMFDAN